MGDNEKIRMDWFKKHTDTVVIIGAVISSMVWMNGKFTDVNNRFSQVDKQFSLLEKDIAVIKAVMVMKNIMPTELCKNQEKE